MIETNNTYTKLTLWKTYYLSCISIFLSLLSCDANRKTTSQNYDLQLVFSDSITIEVPDTIPDINHANSWFYKDNKISYLINIDELTIYEYDFITKYWNKICISRLQDYIIEYHGPFGYINDSTIIYSHSYKSELLLIDLINKKVIKKYDLPEDCKIVQTNNLDYFVDTTILIVQSMYDGWINESYIEVAKLSIEVNRESGDIVSIAPYPEEYQIDERTTIKQILPDMVLFKDSIVMSFKTEPLLYIYNRKDSTFRLAQCKDQNIKSHTGYSFTGNVFKDAILEEFTGLYKEFIYDNKSKLYYRISLGYPNFSGEIPRSREEINKITSTRQFTVSVLDSNLNMISQNTLEGVSEINHFSKDGKLYLRTATSNESEINFIGFKLIKKAQL